MFAGVCGGIAEYLDVDSTLVRLVFVALALMGGPSLVIYIILMLIVPERPSEKRKAKRELNEALPSPQPAAPGPMLRDEMPVDQDEPPILE